MTSRSNPSRASPASLTGPGSSRPDLTLVTENLQPKKLAALSAGSVEYKGNQGSKENSLAVSGHLTSSPNVSKGGPQSSGPQASSRHQPSSGTIHSSITVASKNSPGDRTTPESPTTQFLASKEDLLKWIKMLKSILTNVEKDMEVIGPASKLTKELRGANFDKTHEKILKNFRSLMEQLANKLQDKLKKVLPPDTNKEEYDAQLLDICIQLMDITLKDPKDIGIKCTKQMVECANWCIQLSTIRFEKTIIDKAIKKLEIALSELQPNDTNRPYLYKIMGNAHRIQYSRTGVLDDVKNATKYLSRAIDFVAKYPNQKHDLSDLYMMYGRGLRLQFAHTGDTKEMDDGVSWLTKALGHTKQKGMMANLLTELGALHQIGYDRLGIIKHIDQAIKYYEEALAQEEKDVILRQLAEAYSGRFRRLAEPKDIKKAIDFSTQAYELTKKPDPRSSSILGLSRAAEASQYVNGSQKRLQALDKAIELLNEALKNDDKKDRVFTNECLFNCGNVYHQRFRSTNIADIKDIDNAIQLMKEALKNTRRNHNTQLAQFAAAIGHSLRDRFLTLQAQAQGKDKTINDLIDSVQHYLLALKNTPINHPERPTRLIGLGITYRLQYERSLEGQGACNEEALNFAEKYFREALTCGVGYTLKREQVNAGFQLAKLRKYTAVAMDMKLWILAMQYVRDYVWIGLSFEAQYVNLMKVADITRDAVAAAIVDGEFGLAILWMAVNQAIALNMALTKHDALDLPLNNKLLCKLRHLAEDLLDSDDEISKGDLSELDRQKRHRIVEDFEDCIKEALAKDNNVFGDLMISPTQGDLIKICQQLDSTVIIINMAKERCDVLSIYQKNITHVPLGNIYDKILIASRHQNCQLGNWGFRGFRRGQGRSFIEGLRQLWELVAQPVLNALGYDTKNKLMLNQRAHITWCTRGPLSFMPIDWAGPYNDTSPNLRDLAISSHIPFISALQKSVAKAPLKSNQSKQLKSTEIIAFTQQSTPGLPNLNGAKEELDILRNIFRGQKHVRLIEGDIEHKDTLESVIDAIGRCENVHFACHASQNVKPLESAIHLTPGDLTVDRIMRLKWRSGMVEKHLAFLSACQTAKGDDEIQDEHLHLAATFYVAGFENVIGTRWTISDDDGPAIAGRYYSNLLKKGSLEYHQSAHALHVATGECFVDLVQNKKLPMDMAIARISAFIHFGSRLKVKQTMSH